MAAPASSDYIPVPLPRRLDGPELRVVHVEEPARKGFPTDERLNFLTHGLGFLLSVVASICLWTRAASLGDSWLILACIVYGLTFMGVYACSTLSHGNFEGERRDFYRMLDQVSIFLFMAATCAPFLLAFSRNPWGMFLLGGTWALALAGAGTKLWITKNRLVPVWYYVLVGWFPAISLFTIASSLGIWGVTLLLTSAACFMVGTWFLVNDHRATWYHAIWHLLVICGTTCQYMAILAIVLPAAQG